MRVRFGADVLAHEPSWRHLDAVLALFEDGRHRWVVDQPDVVERSAWCRGKGERDRRRVFSALRDVVEARAPRRGPHRVSLELTGAVRGSSVGLRLPADEGARLLGRPVTLLVEKVACDGAFLAWVIRWCGRALAAGFDEVVWRERVLPELDRLGTEGSWFRFLTGAGSNLPSEWQRLIADRAAPVFVLVDSDADGPWTSVDELGQTARSACRVRQELGAEAMDLHHLHVLRLRDGRELFAAGRPRRGGGAARQSIARAAARRSALRAARRLV